MNESGALVIFVSRVKAVRRGLDFCHSPRITRAK